MTRDGRPPESWGSSVTLRAASVSGSGFGAMRCPSRRGRPTQRPRLAHGGRAATAGRGTDPAQLRISDAERHQVAEILREAAGEGRLDIDELDQRLEATYAARTYADLVPITLDLPAHPHQRPVPAMAAAASPEVVPGADKESHFAILSGLSRKGVWVVPQADDDPRDDGRRRARPAPRRSSRPGGRDHHQRLHGRCPGDRRPAAPGCRWRAPGSWVATPARPDWSTPSSTRLTGRADQGRRDLGRRQRGAQAPLTSRTASRARLVVPRTMSRHATSTSETSSPRSSAHHELGGDPTLVRDVLVDGGERRTARPAGGRRRP